MPSKFNTGWDRRKRDKHCADCKWGDFEAMGLPNKGLCRRHPPTKGWPGIVPFDFCSEFQQSKKAKDEEDELAAENP